MKSKSIQQLFLIIALVLVLLSGCKKDEKKADDPKPVKPDPATVTDIDGNTYKTVRINTQLWMAENLRVTRFNDGTVIPTTEPPNKDINGDFVGQYQWVTMYDTSLLEDLGRVYSRAVGSNTLKNVCPEGWRVPNQKDWKILMADLGGLADSSKLELGHVLMEKNSLYWEPTTYPLAQEPNNETGFNARGGGIRLMQGGDWAGFKQKALYMVHDIPGAFSISSYSTQADLHGGFPNKHIRCIME